MASDPVAPALLKDSLGADAMATIADIGVLISDRFDRAAFSSTAMAGLDGLSIMERVRHIADALKAALPADHSTAVDIVRAMAPHLKHGFQSMAVTEFVARYGLGHFDRSMEALADLTRYGSAEFAIRPFLAADYERTLVFMVRWAGSEDEHVRRLASEGSRPRLPWAARIPALKDDPTRAISILEALRSDPSAYVRKSVANHLNDIARDRPEWLVDRLERWPQDNPHTIWIIRHALRTLIKQGNPRALALIGVSHGAAVEVQRFSLLPTALHLGDRLAITVDLLSTASTDQRLVVDYRVHYARGEGRTAGKVFKLRSFDLAAGARITLGIQQTIRDFSTRRHYPGIHEVELLINGLTMAKATFDLSVDRIEA